MKAVESERSGEWKACIPGTERARDHIGHGAACFAVELARRLGLVLLALGVACGGSTPAPTSGRSTRPDSNAIRYRLLLHGNAVDPGRALRCYGACQAQPTPEQYLRCLAECPGFEQTPGVACTPDEVPPQAACFTARPIASGSEPDQVGVVIAVIGDVPIAVGLAAVCASQTSPCSYTGAGLVP
jgi:hypothetical protein